MRAKPPREISDRRAISHKPPKQQSVPESWTHKTARRGVVALGMIVGVAGLILTTLEFQARPSASLEAPLNAADALSTPFVISNDGQLQLKDVGVKWYIREVMYNNNSGLRGDSAEYWNPESPRLEIGERKTVEYPSNLRVSGLPLVSVDIVAGVYFRPPYWPFKKRHRLFRLVGVHQSDGNMRLQLQPASDVADEAEKVFSAIAPES